ncbi:hypothetical protein Aduo_000625 [Ancylostoma duodenale]
MLCFSLFIFAVVSSELLPPGAIRPPADCDKPKIFSEEMSKTFVKKINDRRRMMIDGEQKNGLTGANLPMGESVAEMEWSCELEKNAVAALKEAIMAAPKNMCPIRPPTAPNGTTGLSETHEEGSGRDPVDKWLSEMDVADITLHPHPEAYVRCHGKNRNYCNLVRHDASRIGCAETECAGKKYVFCLTNKP